MSKPKSKISTHAEAIQYFIQTMDIEMIDTFLDNDKTYQNFEKPVFIKKLKKAFDAFAEKGDTYLKTVEGKCNFCSKDKPGFTFIGNKSNSYMSIIFDIVDNRVDNLYECNMFINKQITIVLRKRIFIGFEFILPI